jgi:DNA-binding transcriptional ArsR family regulator
MAADGQESGQGRPGRGKKAGKKNQKKKSASQPKGRAHDERRASLVAAIAHPVRRRILRAIASAEEARSPAQMAKASSLPLAMIVYHIRVLGRLGAIKPAGERQARNAIEHFYDSTIEGDPRIETLLEEKRELDEEDE